jgi:hypothetical protein
MALNSLQTKARSAKADMVSRTLAITFPLREHAKANEVTYEDLQEAFGGNTPSEVMRNIFNIAINTKL